MWWRELKKTKIKSLLYWLLCTGYCSYTESFNTNTFKQLGSNTLLRFVILMLFKCCVQIYLRKTIKIKCGKKLIIINLVNKI